MKATSQLCTRKAGDVVRKHALSRFYPTRLIIIHFFRIISARLMILCWSDHSFHPTSATELHSAGCYLGLLPFNFSQDRNFSLLRIISPFFNKTLSNSISPTLAVHTDKTLSSVHLLSALWLLQLSFCSFTRLQLSWAHQCQWAPFDHFIFLYTSETSSFKQFYNLSPIPFSWLISTSKQNQFLLSFH